MHYWLIKTDSATWSWQDQIISKTTNWDGVRNHQATNNLKAMKVGDLCFFYHSIVDRKIMGIVKVTRPYYADPSDATKKFGMVDIEAVRHLNKPVDLDAIKEEPRLGHLALVRQSRLSVMPIDEDAWNLILHMAES